MGSARRARAFGRGIIYLVATAGAVVMVFPLLWTVSTSLKTVEQLMGTRIALIPNPIAWENYIKVFDLTPVLLHLRNTMIIVVCAEFGALTISSLVAYAFAHIPFPGRNAVFVLLLSGMMFPGVVRLVPFFVMFDRLGWINTFLPLVVPRFLAHNHFHIFLMRQFFLGVPKDLMDAARMDGCSELDIWWRIVMPISSPVLAAVAIFTFQFSWNWFMAPLVYMGGNKNLWTLSVGLASLRSFPGENTTHLEMVYATLMIVPMVVVFALGQRHFVQGITFSGIKG